MLSSRLLPSWPALETVGAVKAAATAAHFVTALACMARLLPRAPASGRSSGHGAEQQLAPAAQPLLAEWRLEDAGDAGAGGASHGCSFPSSPGLRAAAAWHEMAPLLRDGANVLLRSLLAEGVVLLTAVAAARLGAAELAAHQVASMLWVLPCHLTAGLQTAALVLGGRLAARACLGPPPPGSEAAAARGHWRRLARRLLLASALVGGLAAAGYALSRPALLPLFTADARVAAQLRSAVWPAMCIRVLLFCPTIVLTGCLFATQRFALMRSLQLAAFALVFLPALAAAARAHTLAALWLAALAFHGALLLAEGAGVASVW